MAKAQRKIFTVEGSGEFPFDMLRYDHAWPYTEAHDSHLLSSETRERRRVVLMTDSPQAPTVGRWESFGWRVVGMGEQQWSPGRRTA